MKVLKWVLLAAFLTIGFLITAAVWFYTSNPKKIVEIIARQLHDAYMIDINVDSAGFDLLRGIELKGVKVSSGTNGEILLDFSRGDLFYNPIALLNKKIDIISITIDGLNTTPEHILNIYGNFSRVKSIGKNPVSVTIHRLNIFDSIITYNKIPFKTEIRISPDREIDTMPVSLSLRSTNGKIDYNGTINNGVLKITGTDIDSLFNTSTSIKVQALETTVKRDNVNNMHCNGRNLKIYYGKYYIETTKPFTLDFFYKTLTLSLIGANVRTGNNTAFISKLSYSIPSGGLVIEADSLEIDPGDFLKGVSGRISGDFKLLSQKGLIISGNLMLSNVEYSGIKNMEGSVKLDNNALEAGIRMKAFGIDSSARVICRDIFTGTTFISADAGDVDIETLLPYFNRPDITNVSCAEITVFKIFPVNMIINTKKIYYKKLELTDFYMNIDASGFDTITVKEMRGILFRGKIVSSLVLSHSNIYGETVLTDARLKDFSQAYLEDYRKLYGSISINGNFSMPVSEPSLMKASFEANIKNGELKDFFLQDEIAKTLYDIPMNDIFFDSIHVRGSLSGLKLTIGELSIDSTDIKALASGEVSLKDNKIDAQSDISFEKGYLSMLPNIARIFASGHESDDRVDFSVIISGEIKKPIVKIE